MTAKLKTRQKHRTRQKMQNMTSVEEQLALFVRFQHRLLSKSNTVGPRGASKSKWERVTVIYKVLGGVCPLGCRGSVR